MDPAPRLTHFVGFKEGDQRYWNAVRVWGHPAFWHRGWDLRARRDVAEGDTVVMEHHDHDAAPRRHSYDDSNEDHDPAARERREMQKERRK